MKATILKFRPQRCTFQSAWMSSDGDAPVPVSCWEMQSWLTSVIDGQLAKSTYVVSEQSTNEMSIRRTKYDANDSKLRDVQCVLFEHGDATKLVATSTTMGCNSDYLLPTYRHMETLTMYAIDHNNE